MRYRQRKKQRRASRSQLGDGQGGRERGLVVGFGVRAEAGAGALLSCLNDEGCQPGELLGSGGRVKESQICPRRAGSKLTREPGSGTLARNRR